jgi:hypothetical protein
MLVLDTTPLVSYVRRVVINELSKLRVPLDLKVGDLVTFRSLPPGVTSPMNPLAVSREQDDLTYSLGDPVMGTFPVSNLLRAEGRTSVAEPNTLAVGSQAVSCMS